jgi:hypothetical protein
LLFIFTFNQPPAGILWGITVTMDYVPLLTVGDAVASS